MWCFGFFFIIIIIFFSFSLAKKKKEKENISLLSYIAVQLNFCMKTFAFFSGTTTCIPRSSEPRILTLCARPETRRFPRFVADAARSEEEEVGLCKYARLAVTDRHLPLSPAAAQRTTPLMIAHLLKTKARASLPADA